MLANLLGHVLANKNIANVLFKLDFIIINKWLIFVLFHKKRIIDKRVGVLRGHFVRNK